MYSADHHVAKAAVSSQLEQRVVTELNSLLGPDVKPSLHVQSRALMLLDNAFETLKSNSNSLLELDFLSELQRHCAARLREEFKFKNSLNSSEFTAWSHSRAAFTTKLGPCWVRVLKCLTFRKRRLLHKRVRDGLRERSDLTVDSGLTMFLVTKALQRAFKHVGTLDFLGTSFSRRIGVIGAALEISAAGSTWWQSPNSDFGGVDTDYAHFDEAIERPKAIVYVSDVSVDSGPTEYFPGLFEALNLTPLQELVSRVVLKVGDDSGSKLYPHTRGFRMRSAAPMFRNLFSQLPAEMRFNSHFGWDVPTTHSLRREFSNRRIQVIGDAGTTLVFDGSRVVHRGGLIQVGERLVIQVVFGLDRGSFLKSALSKLKKH